MNRESLESEWLVRVSWTSSLIHEKNTFCKADIIIFEPEIVSRKTAANTGRKSQQIQIAGEIYKKNSILSAAQEDLTGLLQTHLL